MGFNALRRTFYKQYYCLGASYYIRALVNSCAKCVLKRVVTDNKNATTAITSQRKMQKLYIDFTDLNDSTDLHVLDAIDHKTKFYWAKVYTKENSANVIDFLQEIINMEGMAPEMIFSDRGRHFNCEVMKEFCDQHNIQYRPGKAYWPQGQGCIERVHYTLKDKVMYLIQCLKYLSNIFNNIDVYNGL